MATFQERWDELHSQLANEYRDEAGVHLASCSVIAGELGGLLIAQGELPIALFLMGKPDLDGNSSLITPRPYDGRVRWTNHVICAAADVVYDPMLPEPVELTAYPAIAFLEQVTMHPIAG